MSAVSSHDWKLSQGKVATYHHSHLFKRGGLERHNAAEFPNHEEAGREGWQKRFDFCSVRSAKFFFFMRIFGEAFLLEGNNIIILAFRQLTVEAIDLRNFKASQLEIEFSWILSYLRHQGLVWEVFRSFFASAIY